MGRFISYIKYISCHSSFRGVINHIIFFPVGCRTKIISSLNVKYDRFKNGDHWNWQKHLLPKSQHKILALYSQVCLRHHCRRLKLLRLKNISTYTHIHTHTHTHTHTNTRVHVINNYAFLRKIGKNKLWFKKNHG